MLLFSWHIQIQQQCEEKVLTSSWQQYDIQLCISLILWDSLYTFCIDYKRYIMIIYIMQQLDAKCLLYVYLFVYFYVFSYLSWI